MNNIVKGAFGFLVAALLGSVARSQTTDTIVFGNASSEASHSLNAYFPPATDITKVSWVNTPAPSDPSATGPSDVVAGAQGLSARRLLPRTPNGDVYGGQMDFVMTVDPVKQNYFTVKMYASDPNGNNLTILNCNGREVGVRHGGGGGLGEDALFAGAGQDWWKNRFFYRTEPLPLSMTRGKTTVTLTIRVSGPIFEYAPLFTYVPQYQSIMNAPSLGFYSGYTHTGSLLDPTGEVQGTAPAVVTPRNLEDETTSLNNLKATVNSQIAGNLANPPTTSVSDASFMASCYDAKTNSGASWIAYPAGKTDASMGAQVLGILDNVVTSYAAGSGIEGNDWGGGLGPMGDAIRLTWPLISSSMSATVNYGGTLGSTTRQAAWAKALRASVDSGRYNRQNIANQAMVNGTNIYRANRGLLLVDSTKALSESEALRYVKEACGILPWLGNDQATGGSDGLGGGPTPTRGVAPFGPNWYMCTTKGTTKDGEGFVGSDYGEVGSWMYRVGLLAGDSQLQARGIAMVRARLYFRYPGVDANGFLVMWSPDSIGDRNNNLPGHLDYLGSSSSDDFLMASQGASAIGNDVLGAFQQEINEGQIYRYFNSADPYLPSRWATIKAMAATNVKLPMSAAQPDSAWADEENMVVAAKHGEERFFANMFWRTQPFINGLAKVFVLTPNYARLGDVMVDDVRFRPTGKSVISSSLVDGFATPADNPQEAYAGIPLAIAYRSDLSSVPASNHDGGRGTGYTFRYGHWLVGMNADYSANYTVKLPSNFTSATDLISGQVMSGPVVLAPKTTVVFYLPDTVDTASTPSRSLCLNAIGSNAAVALTWADASAANTYNVLRSTTSGSGYTSLASGLTAAKYTDTAVTNGTTYYYVVTATNSLGTSAYSPEASAAPVAPETAALPAPWTNVDEGVSTGGSATLSAGTFTVKSNAGNFGGTTEGFQLVYQPMSGDGTFTARVQSQTATNTGGRAGLVLRSSLAQNATMASMTLRASNNADFNYCGGDGGSIAGTTYGSTISAPYWVRLVRAGTTVTGLISSNGTTWTQVGSYTFGYLPYGCYLGLIVNSGTNTSGQTNTSVFTNVNFPLGATTAPSAPTSFVKTATSSTGVSLSWAETTGAASYNVKRGTSASGPFTNVATGVVATNYANYGLTSGATYYYVVTAVNSAGESANSSVVTASTSLSPATLTGLSVNASGTQSVLSWNASAGATGYTISRSTSYAGPYTVVASGVTGTSYTDTGLSAGTLYYYTVTPGNGGGNGSGGIVSSLGTGLSSPWLTQDIGSHIPGAASSFGGTFTLYGNGSSANASRYVYRTLSGDGSMTVRLASQSNASNDVAGIMVRESLDEGSRYIALYARSTTSGTSVNGDYRTTTGGTIVSSSAAAASGPIWLKLIRGGSSFTLFTSADGVNWASYAGYGIPLNTVLCIGMLASSGDTVTLNTAVFDTVALTRSVVGGGTATASTNSSQAASAFDNNTATKWGDGTPSVGPWWLQYQLPSAQVVDRYTITSADDTPGRDPAAWQFQGSNDGSTWTTLDTRSGETFTNRFQVNNYTAANSTPYLYYRVYVTANAGGSSYGMQISEIGLSKAIISGVANGGSATASTNSSQAPNAFDDNSGTKWGDGTASAGPWWLQYQLPSAQVVNQYTLTSGNDVPGRDPATWQFQGSNDGATWTTLDTRSGQVFANRFQINGYNAANTTAYLYYRLNITANAGGSGYGIQLNEFNLYSASAGSGVANGGTATASTNSSQASSAFDNNTGTKWGGGTPIGWLQYQLPSAQVVNQYTLTSANDVPGRDPAAWQFQGSNDGATWTTLDTRSGQVFANRFQVNGYNAANMTAYLYYRLNITANAGGSGYGIQLSEFNLYAQDAGATLVPPAAPLGLSVTWSNAQISLSWQTTSGAVSYNVKRATTSGGPYTTVATGISGSSYADTTVSNATAYYYVVTAVNAGGESVPSLENGATAVAPPAAPTGLAGTSGDTQAILSWTAASGAASYKVKRATTSGGPYVIVGVSASSSYTDTGLVNSTAYYYVVSAVNLAGESANSAEVAVTPYYGVASASTNSSQAPNVFDNNAATKWGDGVTSAWLQYKFQGGAKVVVAYLITSANDVPQRDPAAWQFQGSNDGSTWTTLDTRSAQTFSARYQTNLYTITNTTAYQYYRLNITANAGGSGYGLQLAEIQFIFGLPSPWSTADIGAVAATGAAGADSGIYTVAGSGADINSTADEFRYVYQAATGDCDITARVNGFVSQTASDLAGVMIRETLNANSANASVTLQQNGSVAFRTRVTTGATTTSTNVTGLSTPYWVRITRVGNVFTAYRSPDGSTWTQVGSATSITMATSVYIGLPATSVNDGALSVFTIDNVTPNP